MEHHSTQVGTVGVSDGPYGLPADYAPTLTQVLRTLGYVAAPPPGGPGSGRRDVVRVVDGEVVRRLAPEPAPGLVRRRVGEHEVAQ